MIRGMAINGTPDESRKSCFDCDFCKGAVAWWCTNEQAVRDRGTKIPGVINCPQWKGIKTKEVVKKEAHVLQKLFGFTYHGYVEVDLLNNKMIKKGENTL